MSARQVLKLSGPPDVVAAVPYVVGFAPVESLVVIALTGPRQEILHTLRVDLSDIEETRRRSLVDQPCHPQAIAKTLKRNGATGALVVILTESPAHGVDVIAGESIARELQAELTRCGIPVRDAMLVQDGRWFSYLCSNPECCPAEGTPIAGAAHDRIAAEMILAGDAPLSGREEIERQVAPESNLRAQAVETTVDALLKAGPSDDEEDAFVVLRRAFQTIQAGEPLEPEMVARCLIWLNDVLVRDGCLQPWEGDDGETALQMWCALTRLAPDDLVAPPASLAAFVAMCRGSGALANAAIDRALRADPTYYFGQLLHTMAAHAMPPKELRRVAARATQRLGQRAFTEAEAG